MVEYKCKKCSQYLIENFYLINIKNRKTNCSNKGSKNNKKLIIKCNKCNRIFSRKDSLNRHTLVCKIKKMVVKKKNTIQKGKNLISIPGHNNIALNKSKVYNINLMVFAKDGNKNISTKDLTDILKSNKNIFESIISNVNLNPDKPQHHNIYYADTKSTYGEVYENKKWVRKK